MQYLNIEDLCLVDNLILVEKLLLINNNLADPVYSQFEIHVQNKTIPIKITIHVTETVFPSFEELTQNLLKCLQL